MLADVLESSVAQTIAIVLGAFIISGTTYVVTRNRQMYGDVREIKHVLITPEPTKLEPEPKKGLIDVVGGLKDSVDKTAMIVQEHGPVVTQLRIDVDNNTHRIGRIEKHIGIE